MPGVHSVVLNPQNTQPERTGAGGRIFCPRIFGRDLTNIIDQPRAPVRQNQNRSTQQTDGAFNTNLHLITARVITALQSDPPPEARERIINEGLREFILERRRIMAEREEDE